MKVTIDKQDGYGPYLLPLTYRDRESKIVYTLIFSHEEDRREALIQYVHNGHEIISCSDLAVDRCRIVPIGEEVKKEIEFKDIEEIDPSMRLENGNGHTSTLRT